MQIRWFILILIVASISTPLKSQAAAAPTPAVQPKTLEQLISREDPEFAFTAGHFAVGKDGKVYLGTGDYVQRYNLDGSGRLGSKVTYAIWNVAANADGVIATANAHFNHAVKLWSPVFAPVGSVTDFLSSDVTEWFGPCDVQAGKTDFYGSDQNRDRIVRISPPGKMVTTYSLAATGESYVHRLIRFRVWESGERFYVCNEKGTIHVISFDGKLLWSVDAGIGGNPWDGYAGSFDVDDAGTLLVIGAGGDTVHQYDANGKPLGDLKLAINVHHEAISDLCVAGGTLVVKRRSATELFEEYDRASGAFIREVDADIEHLKVTYQADVWTAGVAAPLTISLTGTPAPVLPKWHVWLRPLGTAQYSDLPIVDGAITPPTGAAGLYQFKVTAGVAGSSSEYLVQDMVEIRPPGAKGSATVMTPGNRVYYGRGEEIPVTIELRGAPADLPGSIDISLTGPQGTVASTTLPAPAPGKHVELILGKTFTQALCPGQYRVNVHAAGLTCMAQPLTIGPGSESASPFRYTEYGDYVMTFPSPGYWDSPETIANDLARKVKLGQNQFADRLGSTGMGAFQWPYSAPESSGSAELAGRLSKDSIAVSPSKMSFETPYQQMVAGYSAHGIRELGILMNMDAGLPIGTLWDSRKPETVKPIISNVTQALETFPAFRGWVWAANWWPSKFGADAAVDADQHKAYDIALKAAQDTGKWDPVLDQVSDQWLGYIPHATDDFASVLKGLDPSKLSDDTGPYRSVDVYPPVTFKNADEVDLHYQSEQIQPPLVYPHDVDFQMRPGKPGWAHPELWNDDGTGSQILPVSFMMMMRGTDGIGESGAVPYVGRLPEDARQSSFGMVSEFRALGRITSDYGPWLTTLHKADSVAILCSPRMFRIDNWGGIGGKHFTRLYEAYAACLYAHHPASFVFLDDMTPSTLGGYKAALIIDQEVEMEPQLKQYLDAAKTAGTAIFYDDTCRKALVADYRPLGVAFDKVDADPGIWNDDSNYPRFTDYFHTDARAVVKALDPVVTELASVDKMDVFPSVLASGSGRYLFVVNNTLPNVEPGVLWRMDNYAATRVPVTARITKLPPGAVYDVFGFRDLTGTPTITASLGSLPGRIYAILPKRIASVALRGPKLVRPGQSFEWAASVRDASGEVIDAAIPIRVRLIAGDGSIMVSRALSANIPAARGKLIAPLDLPQGPITLEATELFSGKRASMSIELGKAAQLAGFDLTTMANAPANVLAESRVAEPAEPSQDSHFGLHFRDIALNGPGDAVLATAMNWDSNVAAGPISAASGSASMILRKIGNGFAYAPQAAGDGFAVEGYDVNSPQGYFLYLTDRSGHPLRRFGLYGLPKRMRSWAGPQLSDNDCNFAVPTDGSWVATSGDLGLALWRRDGKLIFSKGALGTRRPDPIFAAGSDTLMVPDLAGITAYNAHTGSLLWTTTLAVSGSITGGVASIDGRTVAVMATTEGGRVYVLRDGKLISTLNTAADAIALSPDASHIAVTINAQLLWYDVSRGLQWAYTGDDTLHFPRIDPRGERISVASELGTVSVLSTGGSVLLQRDMGELVSPVWLPDGGMGIASWAGRLIHLSADYRTMSERQIHGGPSDVDAASEMIATDTTPSITAGGWTNSAPDPSPLTPNLLKDTSAIIQAYSSESPNTFNYPSTDMLVDGKTTPPDKPWLDWTRINYIDSGWTGDTSIQFDTLRTQLHVTGITLVEDAAHPESWLRDTVLKYWDAVTEEWVPGPTLLSNSVTHTHMFDKPIDASKFRLVTSGGGQWPAGNIRLAEVVFHGAVLGSSNPDVIAKRPVAVLFDENESDVGHMGSPGTDWKFNYTDALTGGKSIEVEADKTVVPSYVVPYGHALPNWDFPIAENPGPGEYRYLNLAWKAGSPQTTAMSIWVGLNWPNGGAEAYVGKSPWTEGIAGSQSFGNTPPKTWTRVTVDLWQIFKRPVHIYAMGLSATGGPALFDDITVSRTPQ